MSNLIGLIIFLLQKIITYKNIPNEASKFLNNLTTNEVILTNEEIIKYNAEIKKKTTHLYDLNKLQYYQKEVINLINSYQMPSLPKYTTDQKITSTEIQKIIANSNIINIPFVVTGQKALVSKRTNLRAFPTNMPFYDTMQGKFDRLQETSLSVNTPILVLHKSKDQQYLFVMAPDYYGWVLSTDVIYVVDKTFSQFKLSQNFVIVTASSLTVNDIILDMGLKLPLKKITPKGYEVLLPNKKTAILKFTDAHQGYLPYTKQNIIIQALKYENMPYSWGSKDYGIDCSDFIQNIYQTFGFIFPRNTTEQVKSIGTIINLKAKTNEEKIKIIRNNYPSILYQPGHALLYLGPVEGKDYVIDASGNKNNLKVMIEVLDSSNYLNDITTQVLIP